MATEKMSVHEALSELKTLDSRIKKAMGAKFVAMKKHESDNVDGVPVDDVIGEIKAAYNSAVDLIRRRDAIKRAVVASNATTNVNIGGIEYSVAEAIDAKSSINYYNLLASNLSRQLENAQVFMRNENGGRLEDRAANFVRSTYGDSTKTQSAGATKAYEQYMVNQAIELIDPLGVAKKVEDLRNYYETFMTKVDAALSVSNAVTAITVEY